MVTKTDVIPPVGGVSSVLTVGGMARSCLRTRSNQLDALDACESSDRDIGVLPDARVHVVAVRWATGTLLRVGLANPPHRGQPLYGRREGVRLR